LSLSKLVRRGGLVSKLESRSWKLGKYEPWPPAGELRVSKASLSRLGSAKRATAGIDTSPGAPGTTLNENRTFRSNLR
jgi:hypothetical protein